ncbi:MAG: DUF371 domain-containing protein [Candidatus Hydrothermarchaeales archaeon]
MDVVVAHGHKNVTAEHNTTIEVTRDREIGRRADCIIGVNADKGLVQLSDEFKAAAKNDDCAIRVLFKAGGVDEVVMGRGHSALTFKDEDEMVIRKSDFICPRTLMIRADKGAKDLDRGLIEALKNGEKLVMEISLIMGGAIGLKI